MSPTYTSAENVQGLLQRSTAFSTTTQPTLAQVETIIERKEGIIEKRTNHAWQSKTITKEYHDMPWYNYEWGTGVKVFLNHRDVKTLDTAEGDKIEIWNGSSWEDWVASSGRTEGRASDYWLDYGLGILFLKSYTWSIRSVPIRVTYRYGTTTVASEVEELATKMTAIDLVIGDDRSVLIPEGTSNVPLMSKVQIWREEIERIFQQIEDFIIGVR